MRLNNAHRVHQVITATNAYLTTIIQSLAVSVARLAISLTLLITPTVNAILLLVLLAFSTPLLSWVW